MAAARDALHGPRVIVLCCGAIGLSAANQRGQAQGGQAQGGQAQGGQAQDLPLRDARGQVGTDGDRKASGS